MRRLHSNHEHESPCRGDQRRRIISTIEKFMYELEVLNNSFLRSPDLRRHLGPPVVVSGDRFTVAREIERRAALPIGAKYRADAAPTVPRPAIEREDGISLWVPRSGGRRALGVARTLESEDVLAAVLGLDSDESEGPRNSREPPPALRLAEGKPCLGHVGAKRAFVGRGHVSSFHTAEPLTRWSGTRSKAT
jgi:hypothetical protein